MRSDFSCPASHQQQRVLDIVNQVTVRPVASLNSLGRKARKRHHRDPTSCELELLQVGDRGARVTHNLNWIEQPAQSFSELYMNEFE